MLLKLVRVVLSRGERKTGRDDTLDRGVIREVEEERNAVETTVLLEVLLEETCSFHVHTHGSEDNGEVVFVAVMHVFGRTLDKTCLPHDLRSNLDAGK